MNSGLYQISIGNYFYIGQAQNLKQREYRHLYELKKGTHGNPLMQNVWNKHQDFHFQEILYCSVEELNDQEQRMLDALWGTEGCMNICKDSSAPNRGLKLSEETKKKISEALRGEKNHMYGKKMSEESRKKMSEAKRGVYVGKKNSFYDHTQYTFLHEQHGEVTCTQYQLRTKYNLSPGNLSSVISGNRKSHKGWRLKSTV